jgi:hypothetical protein
MVASKGTYTTAVATPYNDFQRVGEVTSKTITQQVFDVNISADDNASFQPDTEFILRVNGRIITRMNEYRARRLGLIL